LIRNPTEDNYGRKEERKKSWSVAQKTRRLEALAESRESCARRHGSEKGIREETLPRGKGNFNPPSKIGCFMMLSAEQHREMLNTVRDILGPDKATRWWMTPNPLLGHLTPFMMSLKPDTERKLYEFIKDASEDNIREFK